MAYKQTMAIIGATTAVGKSLAQSMIDEYCLLLMDEDALALAAWSQQLQGLRQEANLHQVDCCKEASWEADVIFLAVPQKKISSVVEKIREVSTRKMVIYCVSEGTSYINVQDLLPFAEVIVVHESDLINQGHDRNFIVGKLQKVGNEGLQDVAADRGTVSA